MKNKITKYVLWIITTLVLVVVQILINYKFEVHPAQIRSLCDKYAREAVTENRSEPESVAYKTAYDSCFRQYGVRPESN